MKREIGSQVVKLTDGEFAGRYGRIVAHEENRLLVRLDGEEEQEIWVQTASALELPTLERERGS